MMPSDQRDSTAGGPIALGPDLTLPLESVTETFAILANRGSGKSTTAHRLVEQMLRAGLRVVVIDVKGDWWGIRSSADGTGPGLPVVIFGGDHGDVPLEPTAGDLLADLIANDHLPAVLDLSHMSKSKARSFATAFAEGLYRRNRDPLHVVIEEADVLVPQRSTSDTARLMGAMEDIGKRGRHRGLGMTLVSQRGQEVAKSVLELMETVILLRMTGPRSIKAAQDWIGVNADAAPDQTSAVISSLPTLRTGEAWVWSPAFLRILQRVHIDKFETFDSHATPAPGRVQTTPRARANIDLNRLGAEIAATVERAKDNDPRELRDQVIDLSTRLSAATDRIRGLEASLDDRDHQIAALTARLNDLARLDADLLRDSLRLANQHLNDALGMIHIEPGRSPLPPPHPTLPLPDTSTAASPPTPSPMPVDSPSPTTPAPDSAAAEPPRLRAGARRMIDALARMAPLRLTKAQWATVAHLKHTGGTWTTYLGELRRAGFLDETSDGVTLTAAGFAYLGGPPPTPMTAAELQQHYLSILRSGAARMLQAVIAAYPDSLTREEIAQRSGIAASGGTFTTYLGELRRNGLVTTDNGIVTATDVLIHGANLGAH